MSIRKMTMMLGVAAILSSSVASAYDPCQRAYNRLDDATRAYNAAVERCRNTRGCPNSVYAPMVYPYWTEVNAARAAVSRECY